MRPSSRSMAIGIVSLPLRTEEAGRAELAERDRGGQTGARHERPPEVGQGDLPPRPQRRRAECRRRVDAARGSTARSTASVTRTTNGTATSAWPTGTIHHSARQSNGGVSNVMSMPNPIVTADVPIGSIRPVSSSRPSRPRGGDRERGQRRRSRLRARWPTPRSAQRTSETCRADRRSTLTPRRTSVSPERPPRRSE